MTQRPDLNQLSTDQLRALAMGLLDRVESKNRVLAHRDAVIEKLTHETAILNATNSPVAASSWMVIKGCCWKS